jgi:hypothetical protein
MRFTGSTVPSAFERCAIETILVRGVSSRSNASRSTAPESRIGATASRAPLSSQSICHGTMFEWCSSAVIRISSPARTFVRPHVCATRFTASVVPRTKTISCGSAALRRARAFSREASYASVA